MSGIRLKMSSMVKKIGKTTALITRETTQQDSLRRRLSTSLPYMTVFSIPLAKAAEGDVNG
jgi:hypothetical protein